MMFYRTAHLMHVIKLARVFWTADLGINGNFALLTRLLAMGALSQYIGWVCALSKPGKITLCVDDPISAAMVILHAYHLLTIGALSQCIGWGCVR